MTFWYSFEPKKRVQWRPKDDADYSQQNAETPHTAAEPLGPDDKGQDTVPEEDARVRQTRARGQKFKTDARISAGASGESSPDEDHEYLENPQSWNRQQKL